MDFCKKNAKLIIPDQSDQGNALARTTHLCIGSHPDDIEIMAIQGIMDCYGTSDQWFSGVTLTNGGGSPRGGPYLDVTDEQMRGIRQKEQEKAALIGKYTAQIMLGYRDYEVKDGNQCCVVKDLIKILKKTKPGIVYTHNLADKHDTHVSACLKVIEAIRTLSPDDQPSIVLGCEVWRGLDWLTIEDKKVLDCTQKENIQAALLGVYDSQISGGKRYDLAVQGRYRSNATFHETVEVDTVSSMSFAMDMTPLIKEISLDPTTWMNEKISRFERDILQRIKRFQ